MKNIVRFMILLSCLILASSAFATTVESAVSIKWLEKNLKSPNLKIIEMSDASSFIFSGHIPRAVSTNKSDWRYQAKDGSLVHFSVKILEKKMQDLGINDEDGVVIYYKGSNLNEMLWIKAKAPVSNDEIKIKKGNFKAKPIKALHNYFLGLGKFPSNTRYGRIANSISQPWSDFLITDKNGLIYIDISHDEGLRRWNSQNYPLDISESVYDMMQDSRLKN